ncbi:hypothetical protein [Pseudomonas sp. O230]|uniref:hypothetical protein n=1 Tax=Pseudomonas sp. O230 TaxID=3159450 RepID=UPI00387B2F99
MSSQDTRNRLIYLIKEHQLEHGLTKIQIGVLSERAGITRQAFNRFYNDLKPYSQGQSIAPLLAGDNGATQDLLARREHDLDQMRAEIKAMKIQHPKDIESAVSRHLTTLMNSDLMMFEAKGMTATLENQSKHNEMLKRQLMVAQVENTRLTTDLAAHQISSSSPATRLIKNAKNFLALTINFSDTGLKSNDYDAFEDAKDKQLDTHIKTLKKFPAPEQIEIHIFQERYISAFKIFCSELPEKEDMLIVAIQAPVYAQAELKELLRKLTAFASVTLHIPFSKSLASAAAFQKFNFREVPAQEFEEASKARIPQIDWGFDGIQVFRAE